MVTIDLTSRELMDLIKVLDAVDGTTLEHDQTLLDAVDIPDELVDRDTWVDAQLSEKGYDTREEAYNDDPTLVTELLESYQSSTSMQRMMYKLGNACPVCGDPECDEGIAFLDRAVIHKSRHPENQPRGRR
jgi:hypothetical protein